MPTEAPQSSNWCSTCNKSFSTNSHLLRHAATHNGMRKRECPFCRRTFSRIDAVRRHIRTCAPPGRQHVHLPTAKRGKKRRSCEGCRQLKMACDGTNPCARCCKRGTGCLYDCSESATSAAVVASATPSQYQAERSPSIAIESGESSPAMDFLLRFTEPGTSFNSDRTMTEFLDECQLAFHRDEEPAPIAIGPDFSCTQWYFNIVEIFPVMIDEANTDEYQALPNQEAMELRIGEILYELSNVHNALFIQKYPAESERFNWELAASVFTSANFHTFLDHYFRFQHPYNPILQPKYFQSEKVEARLLLAMFLFGSLVSPPTDSAISARCFCDVVEEFIFRHQIFSHSFQMGAGQSQVLSEGEIQVLQAAQIIHILQGAKNQGETRRRTRVERQPRLVAILRHSGALCARHSNDSGEYLRTEALIRLGVWTFIVDVYFSIFMNNPPQIAVSELTGDFPNWDECDGDNPPNTRPRSGTFQTRSTERLSPYGFVSSLLCDSWPGPQDGIYSHTSSLHLLIVIFCLLSMAGVVRKNGLADQASNTLLRGTDRWKELWEAVAEKEKSKPDGFAKHVTEFWSLARMIIRAGQSGDTSCRYLRNEVTDSLNNIHEFMQLYKAKGGL